MSLSRAYRAATSRSTVLREVIILVLGFLLFERVHAAVGHDVGAATAHGLALQSAERALHLTIEQSANQWLTGHPVVIELAVYLYRSYYVFLIGVLAWVFVRHSEVYLQARRTLIVMTLLALPVFWAFPVSPPRFAQPGIADIVAAHDILGNHPDRTTGDGPITYSAMPSLHVGWSAWCAYAVWSALRFSHPRLALAAWLFPVIMVADVLGTGNHYVLDVAGSAALLAVSIAVASLWGRLVARVR